MVLGGGGNDSVVGVICGDGGVSGHSSATTDELYLLKLGFSKDSSLEISPGIARGLSEDS